MKYGITTGNLLTYRDQPDVADVPANFWQGMGASARDSFEGSFGPLAWKELERRYVEGGGEAGGEMLTASAADFVRRLHRGSTNPQVPMLSAEEANDRFAIGDLKFDGPVSLYRAVDLNQRQKDMLRRQDIVRRSQIGFFPQFVSGLGGAALDPVNIAASFVPMGILARTGLAAGVSRQATLGMRATYGAAEGAIGGAMLAPGTYALSAVEGRPYTVADAFIDVAFGTALGAGLHAGIGSFQNWRKGKGPMPAISQAVENSTYETKVQLARGAVADVVEGRPVNVAPVIDSAIARMDAADILASAPSRRKPPAPKDFLRFIAERGGVREEAGELAAMDALGAVVPGRGRLVREAGRTLDEIGEIAHEAGYFGDPASAPRPTQADVLDAIRDSLAGRKRYSVRDEAALREIEAALKADQDIARRPDRIDEIRTWLEEAGRKHGYEFDAPQLEEMTLRIVDGGADDISVFSDAIERAAMQSVPPVGSNDLFDVPFESTSKPANRRLNRAATTARADIARSKLDPWTDPEFRQASTDAAEAIEAADTPIKARSEDQGIGSDVPEIREMDRIIEQADQDLAAMEQLGTLSESDKASLKEADEAVKRAEERGKMRDLAAICLSGAGA